MADVRYTCLGPRLAACWPRCLPTAGPIAWNRCFCATPTVTPSRLPTRRPSWECTPAGPFRVRRPYRRVAGMAMRADSRSCLRWGLALGPQVFVDARVCAQALRFVQLPRARSGTCGRAGRGLYGRPGRIALPRDAGLAPPAQHPAGQVHEGRPCPAQPSHHHHRGPCASTSAIAALLPAPARFCSPPPSPLG